MERKNPGGSASNNQETSHSRSGNPAVESSVIEPGADSLTYDRYLRVDDLLALQVVQSNPAEHDETLFIIIHQVYELWFKQVLHEIEKASTSLRIDSLTEFLRTLKRIHSIQKILVDQVAVLETMTPSEFNRFRSRLNPASGFQSHQFRIVEFKLGLKDPAYLKFFRSTPHSMKALQSALETPSVYDEFVRYLARRGYAVPESILQRDVAQPWQSDDGLKNVLLEVYRQPERHLDIYNALEALVDLDEQFMLWRYRHVAMVERMIGFKRGTGGSSGVEYLTKTLAKRFFPELWQLRSDLGSIGWG